MTLEQVQHAHTAATLDSVALLCAQVREVNQALEACLDDWLGELAPSLPPAGSPQVSLYVHAATVEDLVIHSLLRGVSPLFTTTWQGRGPATYSALDLGPIRGYARDVFAAVEGYLAQLSAESASETVDLSRLGPGVGPKSAQPQANSGRALSIDWPRRATSPAEDFSAPVGNPSVAEVVSRFVVLELSRIGGEMRDAIQRPGASP